MCSLLSALIFQHLYIYISFEKLRTQSPLFGGEYFDFWKIHTKAHLEAKGEEVWDAVENGLFVPTSVVNGVGTTKIKSPWDEDDKKKVIYNKKTIN